MSLLYKSSSTSPSRGLLLPSLHFPMLATLTFVLGRQGLHDLCFAHFER